MSNAGYALAALRTYERFMNRRQLGMK
jgi:hypothetical protein